MGAFEVCWSLFESRGVPIIPNVVASKIHSEGGKKLLLRGKAMQTRIEDYSLIRCLVRSGLYAELKFLGYFEQVRLNNTLSASLKSQASILP